VPVKIEAYQKLTKELSSKNVTFIAVSKTKSIEEIQELYELGQRDFGENYVQELVKKYEGLPKDIRWHFIGHLQRNKVKHIISIVQLIQSVDSLKLLNEINKEASKQGRVVNCLLQVHIAQEETKFGLNTNELKEIIKKAGEGEFPNARITGLMGMASLTEDVATIRNEFKILGSIFKGLMKIEPRLKTLSMGMTSDYKIAIEEGSNMVRIGSLIFGERVKK
jgi:pyridoxal phosphate enzyme (YggS family)